MINERSEYFNIDRIQILVILVIVYLSTIFLFRYLIKSNKIKASKVSRIFYKDDEKFIKDWKKNRKKHKSKYVLYNFKLFHFNFANAKKALQFQKLRRSFHHNYALRTMHYLSIMH